MKTLRCISIAALTVAFAAMAYSQKVPAPAPTVVPEAPAGEDVIRISSQLVLIDALVVDGDNKQVKDLAADDFEIYQDGKRQEITSFSYVDGRENTVSVQKRNEKGKDLRPPPTGVRGNTLGRIITFVIDDGNCLATLEGIALARDGVKKFISEQMRPDDKVAIYRTRGGSSLLQMYTSNKEVLRRSVNKVNWSPSRCGTAFEAARDKSTIKVTGQGASSFESESDRESQALINENERQNQVIGSVGVLGFVVERLKVLPQRKLVFFVSEGINTTLGSRAYDALRELADKASRASVVIYTLGAKGVSNPGFISAQDEVLPGIITGQDDTFALRESRDAEERALNEGMSFLAYSTGGKFLRNRNFLETAVEEVLEVETGYYLLGYQPDDETFDGKEYHRIEVRVKRPELRVSSRKGFIGRRDSDAATKYRNAKNPVYEAIASPFTDNSIDIRFTPLVKDLSGKGGTIRTLFHVDGSALTFTDEPDGLKKVVLNVVLVALDEKGRVVEEFNRAYPIRVPERGVSVIREKGLDYSTDMPISRPGFYSFRVAVQDDVSKLLGTAGDYVEIPKPSGKNFFISSLVTTSTLEGGVPLIPKTRPVEAGFAPVFETTLPSIRIYKPGTRVAFVYDIHNAQSGSQLTSAYRIYRDGVVVLEGSETPLAKDTRNASPETVRSGSFFVNGDMMPGEYILQVTVTDGTKKTSSSQWIDFEVLP